MLRIEVPLGPEQWDEAKEEFVLPPVQVLLLEHSLVSLSKWESKWLKPFFSRKEKTTEELRSYIQMMVVTPNVQPEVYDHLTDENIRDIETYIDAPMTATTFSKDKSGAQNREIVTAEIIYYWMIAHQIPVKFERWHINRLLTLIRVCNEKNAPKKKRGRDSTARKYAAMNAARRAKYNSKG